MSLCDSNPRTHRRRIGLKAQVLRDLFPPIPVLPAPVLPQEVDPVLRPPDFQALDRFIARDLLATEGHIEVDLTAEEPKTAFGSDPFLVWLKYCVTSRGLSMIVAEHPTEALSTSHLSAVARKGWLRCDEVVGEALMIALRVIVG